MAGTGLISKVHGENSGGYGLYRLLGGRVSKALNITHVKHAVRPQDIPACLGHFGKVTVVSNARVTAREHCAAFVTFISSKGVGDDRC